MTGPGDPSVASNSDKLDQLIAVSGQLTESNRTLALAMVEYQERARTAARRFRITLSVVVIVAFVALAGIYVQLRTAAASRSQIADCITPSGHCYQHSQQRTAAAIAAIVQALTNQDQRVAARAAACAPEYVSLPPRQRTRAIYECIVAAPHR